MTATPRRLLLISLAMCLMAGCAASAGSRGDPPHRARAATAPRRAQARPHPATTASRGTAREKRPVAGTKEVTAAPVSHHSDGPAHTSASITDPPDDAGPLAPAFAEVVGADIDGSETTVRLSLRMKGRIPATPPESSNLIAGFGIQGSETHDAVTIAVQGTEAGWAPFVVVHGQQQPLERGFSIDRDRLIWDVPWKMLEGPRGFRWGVSVAWFEMGNGSTNQAKDSAPDSEAARYQGR